MRIGVVGGLDRSAPHIEAIARDAGHELEHHHGRTAGVGAKAIERQHDKDPYPEKSTLLGSRAGCADRTDGGGRFRNHN